MERSITVVLAFAIVSSHAAHAKLPKSSGPKPFKSSIERKKAYEKAIDRVRDEEFTGSYDREISNEVYNEYSRLGTLEHNRDATAHALRNVRNQLKQMSKDASRLQSGVGLLEFTEIKRRLSRGEAEVTKSLDRIDQSSEAEFAKPLREKFNALASSVSQKPFQVKRLFGLGKTVRTIQLKTSAQRGDAELAKVQNARSSRDEAFRQGEVERVVDANLIQPGSAPGGGGMSASQSLGLGAAAAAGFAIGRSLGRR
jgi:hypothetical protein